MKALDPATVTLYLTVLALAIKFALGALQSGTFNGLLAKFSLPPIPTAVFPWLGAGLGLAAGVVTGLQGGDTIAIAIGQALVTTLTGGIAAMHLQFVSGRDPVVAGGPPKPSPTKLNAVEVAATQIEAKPPAAHRGMIRAGLLGFASAALVAVALLTGCPQAAPVVAPVADCASLVIADALKGMTLAQILAAAGPSCANDVATIINGLLGSKDAAVQATPAFVEATRVRQVLTGASK